MFLARVLTLGFWKKFLLWSTIGFVVLILFGFFGLPYLLKYLVETQATKLLHRQTTVQEVRFNPFYLTLQVKGFDIKDRNGTDPFVSFDELALDLEAASVWQRGPILRDILLNSPHMTVVRNDDLSYNLSDLLEEFTAKPEAQPDPATNSEPLRFSFNNIRLENGRIDFEDRPQKKQHVVADLNIGIPFLSNLPYDIDVYTQPSFAVKVNGTPIELTGRSKPFSETRETSLDVNISNVALPTYVEYVPADIRFKLASGNLTTKLALSFTQPKDQTPALTVNGKIALNQFAMTDLGGQPLVSFPLLEVPVESLRVFARQVNLGTILLQSPEVHLQLDKAGVLNLTTLLGEQKQTAAEQQKIETEIETEKKKAEAGTESTEQEGGNKEQGAGSEEQGVERRTDGEKKEETAPTVVEIPEIRLTDGKITFLDETQATPFQTTLESLNVTLREVSTDATKPITVEVACKSDAGEVFQHNSTIVREPLKADGTVSLQQLVVNRYAPYYAKQLLFDIEEGKVDVSTQFSYAKGPENTQSTALSGLVVALNGLRLRKRGEKEDFLKVPLLAVNDTTIDVEKQTVTVGEVATNKGAIQVRRESDGVLSLATLVPNSPATEQKPTPAPAPRKEKKSIKAAKPSVVQTETAEALPPWLVQVKKIKLDQYAIRFDDKMPPQPVTVLADPLSVTVENFSTEKNNKMKTALRVTVNKAGTIAVDGPVSLSPFAATLKVNSKDLNILPFRPYFADKLKIALTSGAVSADGNLVLQSDNADNVKVTYTGQAAVTKFATVDKATAEDFLKWKSLYITGVNVSTSPMRVDINEVALADFYSRLTINPDTTLNVQGIVVDQPPTSQSPTASQAASTSTAPPPAAAQPNAQSAEAATPIKIAKVTVQGGTVDFSDHFIKPNYTAKLTQLGGRVSDLISTSDTPAEVDMRAYLEDAAPLSITGKINPFSKDLFVDLSVDFKDIDLSPMTPYSGKYAGYTIEKGKLTLNLKYQIANRQLKAENKVVIDQFHFGDSVSSPDATGLPVKLAISLLKDRNGTINLNVPVSGSLDDPQFSVWGTIIQVLTNLIAKAATAPFALLGAALGGGGEEMNQIEFPYGRAMLEEGAQEKVKKIAEALADRPSLNLDLVGYVEKEKDLDGLKRYRFERQLKAQKLSDAGKKESGSVSLDDVTIEQDEYLKYLTMAYKDADFPKPRNFIGLVKDLPQEEMETLLFTHIEVKDEDLHELAKQRAKVVRELLLKTGPIEPGRIFLVEPKSIFAEPKDTMKGSRVELAIK
jgi:uncharacterized protein involved in outer membrane biogenesis